MRSGGAEGSELEAGVGGSAAAYERCGVLESRGVELETQERQLQRNIVDCRITFSPDICVTSWGCALQPSGCFSWSCL